MKKKTVVIACALALAAFAALACTVCAFYRLPPRTDTGYSKIYTEDEILSAEETVKEKFKELKGCKLFALTYAGDEESLSEYDYSEDYDQAIVINSVFLSPFFGGGAWNAREIYTWHFILMRSQGGEWKLLTYGYA
ncbi:MAG: hypothetical protein J5562_06220 [Clostridia bacterium]|nr:hypothetical protein [Clostridia bacterium]